MVLMAIIFIFIGNYVFVPPSFDLSLGSLFIKTVLAAVGMLVLPLLTIKYVFKKGWREFGFKKPDNLKQAIKLTGLFLAANLLLLLLFSRNEEFQFYYGLLDNSWGFFFLNAILFGSIYYLAEEFLFRGFLFLGLFNRIGSKSYLITSVIFAAAHWSKSYTEIIYSFGISWWLCWLTLKTKSFLPAALAHFGAALILNIFINYIFV